MMTSEKATGYDHCCAPVEAFTKKTVRSQRKGRGFATKDSSLRASRDSSVANQSE
jgi:hypothetical protein